jgi:hypothetical protein
MNWKNLSWAIRRSPQWNKRQRTADDFSAVAKRSAHPLHSVRTAERHWKDIGARNAGNQQSIIVAPFGTSSPTYSTNF